MRLRVGDSYAAFGHGVTLSLRMVDPLGVDTALRGGRLDMKIGGADATLLGGLVNTQNIDPIERWHIEIEYDQREVRVLREMVCGCYAVVRF